MCAASLLQLSVIHCDQTLENQTAGSIPHYAPIQQQYHPHLTGHCGCNRHQKNNPFFFCWPLDDGRLLLAPLFLFFFFFFWSFYSSPLPVDAGTGLNGAHNDGRDGDPDGRRSDLLSIQEDHETAQQDDQADTGEGHPSITQELSRPGPGLGRPDGRLWMWGYLRIRAHEHVTIRPRRELSSHSVGAIRIQ